MAQKPFHCPTFVESFLATAALWPRGRAWPISDGVTPSRFLAWFAALVGVPASWPTGFVQAGYTAAIALVRNYIETRVCALRNEFWCATIDETRDQWMFEYGLPDACDPFPDLCSKVAAIGGTRCEYYADIAERAGWSISCGTLENNCGAKVGCAKVGRARVGPQSPGCTLLITVSLPDSPAYTARTRTMPYVGRFKVGRPLACPPNLSPLQCILDRVVHAHMTIVYQTAN